MRCAHLLGRCGQDAAVVEVKLLVVSTKRREQIKELILHLAAALRGGRVAVGLPKESEVLGLKVKG